MVCPQCGTLNPDQREQCFKCAHSLTPARVVEEVRCRWHPDAPRAANCSVCGAPVCDSCAIRVEDVAYCPNCAAVPGEARETALESRTERVLSPMELETFPCASLGSRILAGLIDGFIIGSGAIILAFLIWMFTGAPPGMPWADGVNAFFWILIFLGAGGYFAGYQTESGQTPGYAANDLLLVRRDGLALSWPQAILRYLVSFVSAAFLGLGYLWILWDPDNQAWHDKAVNALALLTSERKEPLPDAMPLETNPPVEDSRPEA